jgi:aminoglycoside phosphotransferase (APT) family kinase protein
VGKVEHVTMATASPPVGLAADPAIPSRDLLLDPDSVAEQLSRVSHHDTDVESCTLRRVKYRIGESLRVVYDVVAGGRHFVMSARTFTNSAAVFRRAEGVAERVLGMPGVAHDPRTSTVWWTLPNDRRLRNLATLLDPPVRVRRSSGVSWDQSQLVEYSPEKSATVRLVDPHGQVSGFAKAYRDRDVLEVATQYNRIAASIALLNGIRTPRALGWARPDRIVVLEPMRGRAWTQLPAEVQPAAMLHFGAALAHIHGLPTDFGRGPFQRYKLDRVRHSADLVTLARPDVAAAIRRLGDKLVAGPPATDAVVCLHGDVHAKNVLFHGDQVHMIDFDQGGSGAAGADIGSMLASLLTANLLHPEAGVEGLGAAFLDGYSAVRPLPSTAELQWYTAAAFVAERAIRAVNRVTQPTLAVLPELLEIADAVLAGKLSVDG